MAFIQDGLYVATIVLFACYVHNASPIALLAAGVLAAAATDLCVVRVAATMIRDREGRRRAVSAWAEIDEVADILYQRGSALARQLKADLDAEERDALAAAIVVLSSSRRRLADVLDRQVTSGMGAPDPS